MPISRAPPVISTAPSILTEAGAHDALEAYAESLKLFDELDHDPAARRLPSFHLRFGDLLVNLAALGRRAGSEARAHRLLTEAVNHYIAHANTSLAQGSRTDAQLVLDNLTRLLPELTDADRRDITPRYQQLQQRLGASTR
jgi:hypothetical protein